MQSHTRRDRILKALFRPIFPSVTSFFFRHPVLYWLSQFFFNFIAVGGFISFLHAEYAERAHKPRFEMPTWYFVALFVYCVVASTLSTKNRVQKLR